jgi:phosphatidylglycerophosphatase C
VWVATVGLNETTLQRSFEDFASRFSVGKLKLRWRSGGLTALEEHLRKGERVVVVTAAPAPLAAALIAHLGKDIVVLGSSLRYLNGGWVVHRHRRHLEKCAVLREAGYGEHWIYAYSDSYDDLPLLAASQFPCLVNGRTATAYRLKRRLSALETVLW